MSLSARAYIALIIAAGSSLHCPRSLGSGFLTIFCDSAAISTLAIPAACLKVSLPGITGTMSVLFVLLLAGIANLGLPETLIIGSTCALVQSFWHAKVRPRAVQLAFSIANIAIAITRRISRIMRLLFLAKSCKLRSALLWRRLCTSS